MRIKINDSIYRLEYVDSDDTGNSLMELVEEKYVSDMKEGDLCIFWNLHTSFALIRTYKSYERGLGHLDTSGYLWNNAVKFESKEQFEEIRLSEL